MVDLENTAVINSIVLNHLIACSVVQFDLYHFVIFTVKCKMSKKKDYSHVEIRILVQSNMIHPSSFS